MKELKEDLKTAQAASQKLKEEVDKLREDYKKKAKGVRSDILEVMDHLPSAFYGVRRDNMYPLTHCHISDTLLAKIDPTTNSYRDIRRTSIEVGEILDIVRHQDPSGSRTFAPKPHFTLHSPQFGLKAYIRW